MDAMSMSSPHWHAGLSVQPGSSRRSNIRFTMSFFAGLLIHTHANGSDTDVGFTKYRSTPGKKEKAPLVRRGFKTKGVGGWGWGICLPLALIMQRRESSFLRIAPKIFHSLRENFGTLCSARHS
jgi:hypothetical protein